MAARKSTGRHKSRQAIRRPRGRFPIWGWVLAGIALGGLLVIVLVHRSVLPMAQQGPIAHPQATAEHSLDPGMAVAEKQDASPPKKPHYDFYRVLSEKEVRIPDAELKAQVHAEQQQQTEAQAHRAAKNTLPPAISQTITAAPATAIPLPGAGAGAYLLQIGAFPKASDAESLKARLAVQGFIAHVQDVSLHGHRFYRVRLGPFHTATQLEAVQQRLASAGITAIALKENR